MSKTKYMFLPSPVPRKKVGVGLAPHTRSNVGVGVTSHTRT
jgi:hypothetical protein